MPDYEIDPSARPKVTGFHDSASGTITHVVVDPASGACAVVDPVLDLDYASGRLSYGHADAVIDHVRDNDLWLEWLIETHVHADHLSASPYIQGRIGGRIGIGDQITVVQEVFGKVFNAGTEFERDGSQFDQLFADGDTYRIGEMTAVALHTPGHTPACMTHVIGDAAFVGDTLFMPDGGTARADFPGGDAGQLFDSIQKVLALPPQTRLFICHDYGPGGREVCWETTVAEERARNIHVGQESGQGQTRDAFIQLRTARDSTLDMPKLIIPSVQVNMRAGRMPPAEDGTTFLKVPINVL